MFLEHFLVTEYPKGEFFNYLLFTLCVLLALAAASDNRKTVSAGGNSAEYSNSIYAIMLLEL